MPPEKVWSLGMIRITVYFSYSCNYACFTVTVLMLLRYIYESLYLFESFMLIGNI